ncbi:MAG TPA: DUF4388 domain-containing protein [Caldithrix abyssi]|uniref:DUF4388 domain-containing protein n=1 Tax=Caldithrix abyssi TaxID=187145 RepID=A0A7V5H5Y3_CALAY|nr:DUF4388 domain-containing protein [Caldisericaceae bacterium]HHE56105.1 DUF4388 domain-containing protein [Caldithrix abyssi]
MIHVAVIAREKSWFDQIITQIPSLPISFRWFENCSVFFKNQELEDWQLIYLISDRFDLLQEELVQVKEQIPEIPVLCTVPKLRQSQRQLLHQLGAKEVFPWPVTRQEMKYFFKSYPEFFIAKAEEDQYDFIGQLDFVDGVELLRSFCTKENTGILTFNWDERNGRIEIQNGQIVHAAYRQLDPLTSVLVLTSWHHGQVSFKEESFISKRTIMLTNKQIFDECLQYRQEREHLLQAFPPEEVKLFTHPDLNFEDFGPSERSWLYKMYKGRTILELRDLYEGDFNFMLKKLKLWLEKQYIIPEEEYHSIRAKKEAEMSTSGLTRLFRKILKSEQKEKEKETSKEQPPVQKKLPYLFASFENLQIFKSMVEES